MKEIDILNNLTERYPSLKTCSTAIEQAFEMLVDCFSQGHKLLIAGNGGSSADAEHIAGELMKGFVKKRNISSELKKELIRCDSARGERLSQCLQQGFPVIALHNHQGLNTAFLNDVPNSSDLLFAEQVLNYGQTGDVLLCISTSGNSENIINAAVVAKSKKLKTICLTGISGGLLSKISDLTIFAPASKTFEIQELHLPIYHCLCLMIESHFFEN